MPVIVMAFSSIRVGRLCRLTTIGAITPRQASGNIIGLLGLCLTAKWKSTVYHGWYRSDRLARFCCGKMTTAVKSDEIPIVYWPQFREFGIRVLDGGSSLIVLNTCPWCGQRLPESLRDKWFEKAERSKMARTGPPKRKAAKRR